MIHYKCHNEDYWIVFKGQVYYDEKEINIPQWYENDVMYAGDFYKDLVINQYSTSNLTFFVTDRSVLIFRNENKVEEEF